MTILYPEGVSVLGNVKVTAVVAVADLDAPKLATEINAGTSVELSCALMSDGWTPQLTQGKGTRRRRLCSKTDTEQLNPATYTIGALMYSTGDPQDEDADITGLMVSGAKVYLVERLGLDAEDDPFTVAEKVRVHYVELGEPARVYDTTADNGEFYIQQEVVYVGRGPVEGAIVT
jgi:hypothetical protein